MERTINHGKLELESAADFPWVFICASHIGLMIKM